MKTKILIFFIIFTVLIFSIFYIIKFKSKSNTDLNSPKIVIIGLDGASWNFIRPLLEEGKLPNIKKIVNEGSYGTLQTIRPTRSIVIWTSIATGKIPQKHGILNWVFLKNKELIPYRSNQKKVKAFWNILSEIGFKVGIVNWLATFPSERVRGFIVSDEFKRGRRLDPLKIELTYPVTLYKKIEFAYKGKKDFINILEKEKLPNYYKLFSGKKEQGKLITLYPNFVVNEKTIELAGLYLYKRFPVHVFAIYFRLIDVVSHFASGFLSSELRERALKEEKEGGISEKTLSQINKEFSRIIEPVYAYSDRIIGRFLKFTGSDTTFFVISDHGFSYHRGGYGHSDTPEVPHGIILVKGPNIKKNYEIKNACIYDIVPTILFILNLPIGKDMDGKVLKEIFNEDFLKKRAVRYINSYEGKIRLDDLKRNKVLDEELIKELKALGYIDK
ncbi:alkaline phosphatase family protein [Candidatus Aminicenantes bacterium AC-335-A11]|jgi:predicted AlkP superfamily phosphohydrolase/phosphomutase|nr:alkaline phosphatase family protein [SCandidatus Aminicenantes bacterium Aminicenantia_JdfR_composite]MCP2596573.1 alkaline phosphatase family protein [Candidatus Aminicenantes bacterium AC-335-G13]MCP2618687.1 alkaline phosphatase family protein [Candidatus Aminicenantes bacterium AC-335-A11]